MKREIATGIQDFEKLRQYHGFYIDKTEFIQEWWDGMDDVTLITRPRRFGKTLNMSMLNCFFSNKYVDRGDLFEELNIWKDDRFRKLQGTYPVIFVTFAGVKGTNYNNSVEQIKKQLSAVASEFSYLRSSSQLEEEEKMAFLGITDKMSDLDAAYALNLLSRLLQKHFDKQVLIFLVVAAA